MLAREPDTLNEGIAAPEQPSGGEAGDPGFDPGGETALPFETAPVAPPPGDEGEDILPLEVEPVEDPDARLVPPSEPDVVHPEAVAPVPPTDVVAPVAPTTPAEPDPGVVEPLPPVENLPGDGASELAAEPDRPDSRGDRRARRVSRDRPRPDQGAKARPDRAAPTETVVVASGETPQPVAPQPVAAPVPEPVAASVPATGTSLRGTRVHVVAPGDSLWSIAKRMLGRDASLARIAREVNRLWSLNEDRIGTGDPDLLMVGTRLRLR